VNREPPVTASGRDKLLVAGSAAGGIGGSVAAMLASLCCVGPASIALLGASGAIFATRLTPFRPALLLVSAALLAFGFWRAYGQRVLVGGRACPVRVGRAAQAALWVSALVWLVAAVFPTS
jgi:mercuric ion transport protein